MKARLRTYISFILLVCFILIITEPNIIAGEMMQYGEIKDVPKEKWNKLSNKRIYFGHQSVGYNIIDGIHDIMNNYSYIKLNIVEETDDAKNIDSFFAHSRVGQNMRPDLKVTDFVNIVDDEFKGNVDISFLKLCYGDVDRNSDVNVLFENYEDGIETIKKKYPNVLIIHFTVPLSVNQETWKTKVKGILGREIWEYADNIKRNEFNELMRREYGDSGLLFDIAQLEATAPDGSRQIFKYKDKKYNSMVEMYSDDGGHLNEKGRKIVAEQLLLLLVNNLDFQ